MPLLLGLRVVFSSPEIFREALSPVLWLAAACALWAAFSAEPWHHSLALGRLKEFYKAFALLAPFPSIIFANHYARFAALVRFQLGFGVFGPREMPITKSLRRLLQQTILTALPLPFVWVASFLPVVGDWLGQALLAIWALNWVVLDAFDDANVLQPGQTLADVERESEHLRRPWFVRLMQWLESKSPLSIPFLSARNIDALSKPWREESAQLEASPRLGLGFALSTAALLATPVLNLLFRPVIIAGATHLLGHIEKDEHAETPEILHEHAPPSELPEEKKPIGERFPEMGKRF